MTQDYKIKVVSPKVKEWTGQYGPMKTYYLQLEGNGEPVSLNQKPETPAPKVGEIISGDIKDEEFGQKFIKAQKPFTKGGGGYNKSPEDRDSIYRCNALNNAVVFWEQIKDEGRKFETVTDVADHFYNWLKNELPEEDKEEEITKESIEDLFPPDEVFNE